MKRPTALQFAIILASFATNLSSSSRSAGAADAPGRPPIKKLIEFGWDEPDTAFLRRHIEEMERTPFDGCVFHVLYAKPEHGAGNFTWECWGRRAFSAEDLKGAREDLEELLHPRWPGGERAVGPRACGRVRLDLQRDPPLVVGGKKAPQAPRSLRSRVAPGPPRTGGSTDPRGKRNVPGSQARNQLPRTLAA